MTEGLKRKRFIVEMCRDRLTGGRRPPLFYGREKCATISAARLKSCNNCKVTTP